MLRVSRGDKAGVDTATVAITISELGGEVPYFTFRYRKDPAGGWAVAG